MDYAHFVKVYVYVLDAKEVRRSLSLSRILSVLEEVSLSCKRETWSISYLSKNKNFTQPVRDL